MARNLFLLAALALVAGCTSPAEPPSSSGIEDLNNTPVVAPAAPAPAAPAATPATVPAKGKLPLGPTPRKK